MMNDEVMTEFFEHARELAGDLVNASEELTAMLVKHGWPCDGLSPAQTQEHMRTIQDQARFVAGQFSVPTLVAYLAALAESLHERLD